MWENGRFCEVHVVSFFVIIIFIIIMTPQTEKNTWNIIIVSFY